MLNLIFSYLHTEIIFSFFLFSHRSAQCSYPRKGCTGHTIRCKLNRWQWSDFANYTTDLHPSFFSSAFLSLFSFLFSFLLKYPHLLVPYHISSLLTFPFSIVTRFPHRLLHSSLPSSLCSPASPTSISPLLPSQVKAKGENFTSQYWKDISSSVLPLHRAVSCLSLYDSESALTGVVNCLAQLGCDFNILDRDGYTALHRAINNCPQR